MEEQIAASGLEARSDDGEPGAMILPVPELERAPVALARLAIWRAMTAAAGGRPVSFRHVEEAAPAHPNLARRCAREQTRR